MTVKFISKKIFVLLAIISIIAIYILNSSLTKQQLNIFQAQPKIKIKAKILSKSKFSKNFKSFNPFKNHKIRNQYKAIELKIRNKENQDYSLENNSIDLIIESPETIKNKLKSSSFFAPFAIAGSVASSLIFGCKASIINSTLLSSCIGVGSSVLSIANNNKKLRKNLNNKSLNEHHGLLIPANDTIKTIFFIQKDNLKSNFLIKLLNTKNQKYAEYMVKV